MVNTEDLKTERDRVIEAALDHVAFDGWSRATLEMASAESGVDMPTIKRLFPRGGLDLALGFHRMIDRRLARELASTDMTSMKIRQKIAFAVFRRIEMIAPHRDAVRRAASMLALPVNAAEGARAVWQTADTIWTGIGDISDDYNWYTKRMILSTVLSSTVLYWLGDDTPGRASTRAFLDRRIENVMQFEKSKAMVQKNPLFRAMTWLPGQMLSRVRAPTAVPRP